MDAGFDVWLGNLRGNEYSLGHDTLDYITDAAEFFDFDITTHSRIDLVTMIEYIYTRIEGSFDKLAYVGHSMGTAIMFHLASEKPEYVEQSISTVIAIAPALEITHTTSPLLRAVMPVQNQLYSVFKFFKQYSFGVPSLM